MPRCLLVLFVASFLAVPQIVAQDRPRESSAEGGWGTAHLGPVPPSPPPVAIDWSAQRELADHHDGWNAFREEHQGWRALFDPRTGQVERAYGPGITLVGPGPEKHEIGALAMSLRESLSRVVGQDPSDQVLHGVQRAGRIWYAHFVQHFAGLRVWNAGLTLRIDDQGHLVMWGGTFVDTDALDPVPQIAPGAARARALAHLRREGFIWAGSRLDERDPELLVHVEATRTALNPTVAWRVRLGTEEPPANWEVFIDAHDGSVVTWWNDIRQCAHAGCTAAEHPHAHHPPTISPRPEATLPANVQGTLVGLTHDGLLPHQAPVLTNLNDIRVTVNGAVITTDPVGDFVYNGGGAQVTATSTLDGPWINGISQTSASASLSMTVGSGPTTLTFDNSNSTIGERDMVFFTNRAHNTLKLRAPAITALDNAISGRANLNTGSCNAFYEPLAHRINFYLPASGCIDTATSHTVVEHEYGHGVTTVIFNQVAGLSVPGHLGEGFSDCIAAACEDTNVIGAGFAGIGSNIRNLNNSCQWPASCGSAIHSRGLVIGGSYWSTRQNFASAFGQAGKDQMDGYLFQHFVAAPQSETQSLMEMLLLDDNDADLTNGTPNLLRFYQGFTQAHGVPFPLDLISIAHEPLNDTLDQIQDYRVEAAINSISGSPVSQATLFYRVGASAFSSLAMVDLGNGTWQADIPVQAFGSTVSYYIQASDGGGVNVTNPGAAPAQLHSFATSLRDVFIADGFEGPSSPWTHALIQQQDDWQRGAPGNQSHQYDPPTAAEGNQAWGNDLSIGNFNGNYQNNANNYLQSPVFNCTGKTGVQLVYRRWLTIEDGLYDQGRVQISVNNGPFTTLWQNPVGNGTQNFIDSGWVEHAIDISAQADNQANVRFRYTLTADPFVNFGGWNVDDFRLIATSPTPILSSVGPMTQGSLWTLQVNAPPGTPYIAVVDPTPPSPTFLPGVGTTSLSLTSPFALVLQSFGALPSVIGPTGQDQLAFVLPSNPPQIVGLPFNFQAVLVPGFDINRAVISNVETLTIQ